MMTASAASPPPHATFEQAQALFRQNKFAEAVPIYQALLPTHFNDPRIWAFLGHSLLKLHHFEAALACTKRAADLYPQSADILAGYAQALVMMNRPSEAVSFVQQAIKLEPQSARWHSLLANFLFEAGRYDESLAAHDAACALEPDNVDMAWLRGTAKLGMGRLKEGWPEFELRGKMHFKKPAFLLAQEKNPTCTRWTGQPLEGKTIFIYDEQGYGDTLLFSRYIPLVKARGARVIFHCRPALERIFASLGADRLFIYGEVGEKLDYHVPIISLPAIFETTLETIPPLPKLAPAGSAPQLGKRFNVGIVWAGTPDFIDRHRRDVSVARFLPLAEIPRVQLISLQKGPAEKELAERGADGLIPSLGGGFKDFAETAAVVKELDLVITTDNSVAHLAGSLNVPVWNLLSYSAYWIYLTQRDDSPWYPSMRLFRQPTPGDWDSVFKNVADALRKAAA